jgi:hypothetical protein
VAIPLIELTKQDQVFMWIKVAAIAFINLKTRFTTVLILSLFDPELRIVVETDVSDFALGGCLSQLGEKRKLKPITYYSRKLSPTELNYDVHNKELLVIVKVFK